VKTIRVVYYNIGVVDEVPVEAILSMLRRDGDLIIVGFHDIFSKDREYVYPGLTDLDLKRGEFINVFKHYMGTDKPRLYPICELDERSVDYIIVRKRSGALLKIAHAFPAEVLFNIIVNPGIALWDLIALEVLIEAKELPGYVEEDAITGIYLTVNAVGFYTHVLEIVRMEF